MLKKVFGILVAGQLLALCAMPAFAVDDGGGGYEAPGMVAAYNMEKGTQPFVLEALVVAEAPCHCALHTPVSHYAAVHTETGVSAEIKGATALVYTRPTGDGSPYVLASLSDAIRVEPSWRTSRAE